MASRSSYNDPKDDQPRSFDSTDMEETNHNQPDWWDKCKEPERAAQRNVEEDEEDKDMVDNLCLGLHLALSETQSFGTN